MKPLADRVDQLLRRPQRQALQRAEAGQHEHRQEPQPQVDHEPDDRLRSDGHRPGRCRCGGLAAAAVAAAVVAAAVAAAPAAPIIVGGLGNGDANNCGPARLGGGILFVDGVIYASSPDNVYAIDARDGALLWHYYWKTRGGTSLQTRGARHVAQLHLLRAARRLGRLPRRQDRQGSLEARDRAVRSAVLLVERADGHRRSRPRRHRQRHRRAGVPEVARSAHRRRAVDSLLDAAESRRSRPRDLGRASTPRVTATAPRGFPARTIRRRISTSTAPAIRRRPTRRAAATATTSSRRRCIAVNVDTGKMAWYYQTSPHDTHDWDSTQTPVLVDAPFNGRMRKLVITATRNGYFFVLDRTTGEHLVTSKIGLVNNWASGLDEKGQPKRNPNKDATIAGSLVNSDVTNYPPPTFSPETGLFYVHEQNSMRISYLMEPDPRGSMGLGGTSGGANLSLGHQHRRDRLQDRQDHVAQGNQRRQLRPAVDRGRPALPEQRPERRSVGRGDRQGALVFADRRTVESARDVHARRQAAHAVHRRRRVVSVRAELS